MSYRKMIENCFQISWPVLACWGALQQNTVSLYSQGKNTFLLHIYRVYGIKESVVTTYDVMESTVGERRSVFNNSMQVTKMRCYVAVLNCSLRSVLKCAPAMGFQTRLKCI